MSDPIHEQGTLAARDAGDALRLWERHAGFLRRLARGLVADVGAADDVLQDAWLATAQGDRPEGGRSQRAWLSGVVRNVARKLVRSNARRHGREHRAARAESLPSASDTAARVELLGQVVDAVHDLAEPYRTVLLLRFLDELAPKEIAERQGVPVDTVHTQIRRGLERLRTKLSTSTGCDEGTWLAALLPFATLSRWTPGAVASGTAATTGSVLAPALLMSTASKCTLALGVLALASIATWKLTRPDAAPGIAASEPTTEALEPTPPQETLVETDPAPLAAPPSKPETRVAAAPKSTGWVLRGNATRGGDPFPDLDLVLRIWEGAVVDAIDTERAPDREVRLTTDETGAFSQVFEGIVQGAIATVEPAGSFEGDETFSWRPAETRAEAGEQPAPVELHLVPLDALLVGTVRNMAGEPIAGARVWQVQDPVTTDEDGHYRRPTIAREETYLYATAEGYSIQRLVLSSVLSGQERTADFELKEEFRVEGTVRDSEGRPVRGAVVTSFYTNDNDVLSDSLGRYSLGHLDPGRPEHMVSARKSGFVMASTRIRREGAEVGHADFTLDRGVRVEGHVVDMHGAPVEGSEIYIGFSRFAFDRLDPEVLPGGGFVFPSVRRGAETLVVQADGYAPYRTTLSIPEDRDLLPEVEVVLESSHFIGGHVRDEEGHPMEGVWVTPLFFGDYLETHYETDASGHFRLEGLPGSHLKLEFYAPQEPYQRQTKTPTELDVEDLDVALVPAGGIAGRVVDGITGRPVESFRVRFVTPEGLAAGEVRLSQYSASWQREGHLFESAEGLWDTQRENDLPPGTIIGIQIQAEGYAPAIEPHALVSTKPEENLLTQELFPGGILEGSVLAADDHRPLEGATVKLYRADEPFAERNSDDTHGRRIAMADAGGRFRFENVGSGEHKLLVLAENYRSGVDGPFEVIPGMSVERPVELSVGTTLTGVLRDWEGAVRPAVELRLTPTNLGSDSPFPGWSITTDSDGRYAFTGLPTGTFLIGPRNGDDTNVIDEYRLALELRDEGERAFDVAPAGSAVLVGRVTVEGELPGLLPVQVTPKDPLDGTLHRNGAFFGFARDGLIEIHGIPAGLYQVQLQYLDFRTNRIWRANSPVEVTLIEGKQTEVYLEAHSSPWRR